MNEIIGIFGMISLMLVILYGIHIVSKPHKFQHGIDE